MAGTGATPKSHDEDTNNSSIASSFRANTDRTRLPTEGNHLEQNANASEGASSCAKRFVRIQPGEFVMGCVPEMDGPCTDPSPGELNHAKRTRRVRITNAFEIATCEVTQAEWTEVMGGNPSYFVGADRPVEQVNWYDVQRFLDRLNARHDGYRYRLPTEGEWEFAARAGTNSVLAGMTDDYCWCPQNSGNQSHSVGQKKANAWGLFDMYGNVFEWVQDWDGASLGPNPTINPEGPTGGNGRVMRGNSFFRYAISRVTTSGKAIEVDMQRWSYAPGVRWRSVGFRYVRERSN